MSNALRVIHGEFGRVCLLDMTRPLVRHAHHHVHFLLKVEGDDSRFQIGERIAPLTDTLGVVVNTWESHAYVHEPQTRSVIILAFYIEPEWLAAECLDWGRMPRSRIFAETNFRLDRRTRGAAQDLARLMADQPVQTEEHTAGLATLLQGIMRLLFDTRSLPRSLREVGRESVMHRPVRRALSMISEDTGRYRSVGELAREVGVSRPHLYRLFEESTGVPPKLYMNALRIENAISLLTRPRAQMTAISDELGFPAPAHFSRFFHDHAGSYPTAFRSALAD